MKAACFLLMVLVFIASCDYKRKPIDKEENSTITKDSSSIYFKYKDTLVDLSGGNDIKHYQIITKQDAEKADSDKVQVILYFKDSALIHKPNNFGYYPIYKKYKPEFIFSNYKVPELYTGKLAKPLLNSCAGAHEYRTRIKEECESAGVNFAGHYTMVIWGCGSECTYFAVVDRITGKIFMNFKSVNDSEGYYGYDFQKNSNLLLINDGLTDMKGYVALSGHKRLEYFEWLGTDFKNLNKFK